MEDTVDESIISLKIAGRTHGSIHNMFLENHVVSKTMFLVLVQIR